MFILFGVFFIGETVVILLLTKGMSVFTSYAIPQSNRIHSRFSRHSAVGESCTGLVTVSCRPVLSTLYVDLRLGSPVKSALH